MTHSAVYVEASGKEDERGKEIEAGERGDLAGRLTQSRVCVRLCSTGRDEGEFNKEKSSHRKKTRTRTETGKVSPLMRLRCGFLKLFSAHRVCALPELIINPRMRIIASKIAHHIPHNTFLCISVVSVIKIIYGFRISTRFEFIFGAGRREEVES
jgi:hypothetical protein